MGKMHEALLKAQKETKKNYLVPVHRPGSELVPVPYKGEDVEDSPKWFHELKTKLQIHYDKKTIATIMFTGTSNGDGTTTAAAGFASNLAKDFQHKVLLIDVNFRTSGRNKIYNQVNTQFLDDYLLNESLRVPDFKKGTTGNLYVISCNGNNADQVAFLGSDRFDDFFSKMHDAFDYVIFDTPPLMKFSESQILSTKVGGVILVIESGRTRRMATVKAKEELEFAGAKLLGVVLNRRKFHIPKWLYNRL